MKHWFNAFKRWFNALKHTSRLKNQAITSSNILKPAVSTAGKRSNPFLHLSSIQNITSNIFLCDILNVFSERLNLFVIFCLIYLVFWVVLCSTQNYCVNVERDAMSNASVLNWHHHSSVWLLQAMAACVFQHTPFWVLCN